MQDSEFNSIAAGSLPGAERTERQRAELQVVHLAGLAGTLGLPTQLRVVGIAASGVGRPATDLMDQARALVSKPRAVFEQKAAALCEEAP